MRRKENGGCPLDGIVLIIWLAISYVNIAMLAGKGWNFQELIKEIFVDGGIVEIIILMLMWICTLSGFAVILASVVKFFFIIKLKLKQFI